MSKYKKWTSNSSTRLVRWAATGKPMNELAERWEVTEKALECQMLKLLHGVDGYNPPPDVQRYLDEHPVAKRKRKAVTEQQAEQVPDIVDMSWWVPFSVVVLGALFVAGIVMGV